MPPLDLRLGIDVGGTNTDAVVLARDDRLLAKAKIPTSADVTTGIAGAIDAAISQLGEPAARITHVMLGTTHATNAVLERRSLRRVAVLRIGAPATLAVRPLLAWPADLRAVVSAGEAIVGGGIEYDGREIAPFDAEATRRFVDSLPGDVDGLAIASVFAPVSAEHELAAAEIVRGLRGDTLHVSLSHEIGSVGLLERENATVLNSALVTVAHDVAEALRGALAAHAIDPLRFFAQNDGTLMALEDALRYPVLTIGSGPANSMRGAAYLTGASDAIVADVGGTSTDVGVLANGFPRESSSPVEIGGIRTNFRMPDLVAIALGGGSIVANGGKTVAVGPQSVGFRLQEEALVFGGGTPTLTDAAVLAGRAELGDRARAAASRDLLGRALGVADAMLADAVDRVKTSRADQPLVVVGGGSVLVPERLPGVSEISRPEHFEVANAIGAAIASVSGSVDRIYHPGPGPGGRQAVLDEARAAATDLAVRAGANPERVEIVELEEIPLAYLTTPATRIRAKAAGPLAVD
ncbi:MAG TPA: hydantoinase/oxoprolinase family protein [Gaiellaceae bacterium]|jgi:N-methylhydantoinase A/oxoprolinase/acetone carboxylase beta subunit